MNRYLPPILYWLLWMAPNVTAAQPAATAQDYPVVLADPVPIIVTFFYLGIPALLSLCLAVLLVVVLLRFRRMKQMIPQRVAARIGIIALLYGAATTFYNLVFNCASSFGEGTPDQSMLQLAVLQSFCPIFLGTVVCIAGLLESYLFEWLGQRSSRADAT